MASDFLDDGYPGPGLPIPQARLELVAAIARFRGLQPRDIASARVLEIGCAAGVGLITLAECRPESTFLGVDASERAIAAAREIMAELRPPNVEFRHQVDLRLDQHEPFDFILAPRVYSRVDEAKRDAVLDSCRRLLAPQGIAVVGYDASPGWYVHEIFRRALLFEARGSANVAEAMARIRRFFEFMAETLKAERGPFEAMMLAELEKLRKAEDWQLRQEYLRGVSSPTYLRHFLAHAQRNGLQFLGDGAVGIRLTDELSPQLEERLAKFTSDPIEQEQYRDILACRHTRQTVLCHAGLAIDRELNAAQLSGLHLEARLQCENPNPSFDEGVAEAFIAAGGARVSSKVPIIKAALAHLGAIWPASIPFDKLVAAACDRLRESTSKLDTIPESELTRLKASLLQCSAARAIDVLSRPHPFTLNPGAQPVASPWTRWQAAHGDIVVNRKQDPQRVEDLEQRVLQMLDGTRDQPRMIADLMQLVVEGRMAAVQASGRVEDREQLRHIFSQALPTTLAKLAKRAMLIA